MVKANELSSDINVIKEFEELKLKQKLLIESLKKNADSNQNKLFLEINSKLDFLVKIFTEANQEDTEEEKVDFNSKFAEVLEKIDLLSQDNKNSFEELESKIVELEKGKEVIASDVKVDAQVDEVKVDDAKPLEEVNLPELPEKKDVNVADLSPPASKPDVDSGDLPPIPKPDFEIKIDEVAKTEKKKKWF